MQQRQRMRQMDQSTAATHIQASYRGKKTRGMTKEELVVQATLAAEAAASAATAAAKAAEAVAATPPVVVDGKEVAPPSEEDEAEPEGLYAEIDRDRLCCDILNTSVMAALVGGFALSNMVQRGDSFLEYMIYLMSCFAVHASTCSALTSALLYRVVVRMRDEAVPEWAANHKLLISMPLMKFGMGTVSYLASVILLSLHDLEPSFPFAMTCLAIGLMSMSTVFATVAVIAWPDVKKALAPRSKKPVGKRVAPHGA